MTLTKKIALGVLGLCAAAVFVLALVLSHDSDCLSPSSLPADAERMRAIVHRCYGPPSVLHLDEVQRPVPAADQLLVKVHAAAVNPLDWHYMRGEPYIMRLSIRTGPARRAPSRCGLCRHRRCRRRGRHPIRAG